MLQEVFVSYFLTHFVQFFKSGTGPAIIKEIIPILNDRFLLNIGNAWYAQNEILNQIIPEEVIHPTIFHEGATSQITINAYERNGNARKACLNHYGYSCIICGFNFEEKYGEIGKEYIHVHHNKPLSEIKKEYQIDPIADLIPICPNCHAMIHCSQPDLTIEQLKIHMKKIFENV
ncbi:MAG: HNH endonuclease [Spirochaetes bacterium]|nr:HNH endonuclease [Spirochaetota bacterium]